MSASNTHIINTRFFLSEYKALPDNIPYPIISKVIFTKMENIFLNEKDQIHLFAFICGEASIEPYVDIYVWDSMIMPESYERYVIAEGRRMSEEKKERLFFTVNNHYNFKLKPHIPEMKLFCRKIKGLFPQWHFTKYDYSELSEAFQHMYYASYKSGSKEILYKADLPYIAYMSSYIYKYNEKGSDPTSIVNNLPLRLLRILNKPDMVSNLFYEDTSELSLIAFNNYHTLIKSNISLDQWMYLQELSDESSFFYNRGFNSKLYKMLKDEDDPDIIEDYELYYYLQNQIYSENQNTIPEVNELEDKIKNLSLALEYKRNTQLNKQIAIRSFDAEFEYQSTNYVIFPPQHSIDFLTEAEEQHNCCMGYVESHAKYDTTILFLRRIEDVIKPFVTVEIRKKKIVQVFARYNKPAEVEVYRFLQEYAQKKGLIYDPFDVINFEVLARCESKELRNQLVEYLNTN